MSQLLKIYNAKFYAEHLLYIVDKQDKLIPFYFNAVQNLIMEQKLQAYQANKKKRFLILKYRRGGVTTLEQALNFHCVATARNKHVMTMAHRSDSTEKIFRIARVFYDNLVPAFRPARKHENKRELNFHQLNSLYSIETAGAEDPGRGIQLSRFHGSEVAYWRDAERIMQGISEAIIPDGEIVLESTPNGINNWFYNEVVRIQEGASDYSLIFLPWFIDPQNQRVLEPNEQIELTEEEKIAQRKYHLTPSQIKWRREKIQTLRYRFWQEYPESIDDCFLMREGRIYEEFIEKGDNANVIKPLDIPAGWEVYGGIDFGAGITNPNVYLQIAIRPSDDAAIVFFEHYQTSELLRHFAKRIKTTPNKARVIWADPSGLQERRELMREYGIKTYPADNAIQPGIDFIKWLLGVNSLTGKPLLYITENCINTIREFKNYRWDKEGMMPLKTEDHAMDALRYCLRGIYNKWRREGRQSIWFKYYDKENEDNEQ